MISVALLIIEDANIFSLISFENYIPFYIYLHCIFDFNLILKYLCMVAPQIECLFHQGACSSLTSILLAKSKVKFTQYLDLQ